MAISTSMRLNPKVWLDNEVWGTSIQSAVSTHAKTEHLHSTDLTGPLFRAPLQVLCDMWTVAFGTGFVEDSTYEKKAAQSPEWRIIYARLHALHLIECHYVRDLGQFCFRLIQE